MAQTTSFSISRKGYNCKEVDEYIGALTDAYNQLRENYATFREDHDKICAENAASIKEMNQLRSDCTTLALALQKAREESNNTNSANSAADEYKIKYEEALNESAQLKAELEKLKSAQTIPEINAPEINTPEIIQADESYDYSETATRMISEVAAVVQKLEKDAKRKAEAIKISARMEQERANLIKNRVQDEIRSLMDMLEIYLEEHPQEREKESEE